MLVILAAIACSGKTPAGTSDEPATDDTGSRVPITSDDTPVETLEPVEWTWADGPELPACTPVDRDSDTVALNGVLLLPEGPEPGVVVVDQTTGLITCVGDCDTSGARVVCTDGVISPGLIDTHNHLQYNIVGPWQTRELFQNRYDWRSDGDYWDFRTAYDEVESVYECETMKWAEARAVVGGATSAVGSAGSDCIEVLLRNLDEDEDSHALAGFDLHYSSGTVDYLTTDDADGYNDDLSSGWTDAVLNHVAEGVSDTVADEIDHMVGIGMSGPGQVFVHATDADAGQLAQMAIDGTSLVWSPRSNLALYGATTDADVARRIGVDVAIGPDWVWSGSMNPASELSCAQEYLATRKNGDWADRDLWAAVTHDAARVLGLEGFLGTLEPGLQADISVFRWSGQPYRAVVESESADVRLVMVAGHAVYGLGSMVDELAKTPQWCEAIDVCDAERKICVQSEASGNNAMQLQDVEATLEAALGAVSMPSNLDYANDLLGLAVCEGAPSCAPSEGSTGDRDGDGIADAADTCPDTWNPSAFDFDDDGLADACDPCPLNAEASACAHDETDVDSDGVANEVDNCAVIGNSDQADTDGDGVGDLCDACIDDPPGACTFSIPSIRNPDDPDHPIEGSFVEINGAVVSAVEESTGFFAQDPNASEWAGIYVFDGLGDVEVGDIIDVAGTYEEYYDHGQIMATSTTVTGSTSVSALVVTDPCSIGTGGSKAEAYESMLLEVRSVQVTDTDPDSSDYGEMEVDGCLRIDDALFDIDDYRQDGATFSSITGVLDYAYSNAKLLPRSASDID